MTFSGSDITGQSVSCKYCGGNPSKCGHCKQCGAVGICQHSSTNSANDKSLPSRLESFLTGLMSKPHPANKELYLGDKPPEDDAEIKGFIDRKSVVDIAKTLTNRVSEDLLIRICDSVFNDGIAMEALKKIASLDSSDETLKETYDILESAKLLRQSLPIEHTEAVVVVCRALLQYIMTHHGGDYKTGAFHYEARKTPFMAWRVKEKIQQNILHSQPILVNPGGFDSRKQVDQFYANFNVTDIVLWNHDIWNAAIRGCQEGFIDTKVEKDLVSSVTPQFWQYDIPFTLGDMGQYQLHNSNYDCVGFVLLPITEDHMKVRVPEEAVNFHEQRADGMHLVNINPEVEGVRDAFDNAVKFSRYGISVAIVFMPISDKNLPPEIRFMRPMFEDDPVEDLLHATVLAAAKFLTLKYVAKDDAQICKKELKQDRPLFKAVRHGKVQVPPIKIINLRRAEIRTRKDVQAESRTGRVYNYHELVSPHWKKQWYPSENRYKVIRILQYVRGDLSKPLKSPRERIYKAVR